MNIYVGNLSYDTTEAQLRELFATYGEVTACRIIQDKYSGASKGFGFVEMADKAQAKAAIAGLDGKALGGRTLTVNEARPKSETTRSGGGRSGRW